MSVARRPRILLVLDDERDFSGPSIVLFRLFEVLSEQGLVELRVLTQRSPAITAALDRLGFDHVLHDFPVTYSRANLISVHHGRAERVRKREFVLEQARRWRADLVHLAVHPLGPLLAPALSQEGVPCLVHFHSNHAVPSFTPYRFVFRRCLTLPRVQAAAVSDWTAANVRALGVPHNRISRLYNGLAAPPAMCSVKRGQGEQTAGLELAFIAQIRPEKGLEHFLQAVALLARGRNPGVQHPVTGVIVGRSFDTYYLKQCREMAQCLMRQTGPDLVFDFVGYSPDPFNLRPNWDGVVLPSLFDDPLPTVAIESVCRGLPTIGYARGGLREILGEGRGTLVTETKPSMLAQALAVTMEEDSHARRETRRADSIRKFSMNSMVEAYLALVDALCPASEGAKRLA